MTAKSHGVLLTGSVWLPAHDAEAGLLMHPGSGPSDRDNDVLFPPIREHLLGAGIAVCSFDKRGVGGSGGRWEDAGIEDQADDLSSALAVFKAACDIPIGLFGHSQGGWVVVEAAGRGLPVAFAITNSGPGVSPARQERYSLTRRLDQKGASPGAIAAALEAFDALTIILSERAPLAEALKRLDASGVPYRDLDGLEAMFDDEAIFRFISEIFDYDPATPLSRIDAPVLAVFGASDDVTPVEESIAAFRELVRPGLLEVEVFPGADHLLQRGNSSHFAKGYLDCLVSFIRRAAVNARQSTRR